MAIKNTRREYYQGKLVSYCKKNEGIVRYKLAKIEERFLAKNMRVKPSYTLEDPVALNQAIDELEERVDNAISALLYRNPKMKITNTVIDEYFRRDTPADNDVASVITNSHILLRDFSLYIERFNQEKKQKDLANGIVRKGEVHPTVKDYISTKNALDDYEHYRHIVMHLEDINEFFVEDFIDFLSDEYEEIEGYDYLTVGPHTNKTINKRLQCFSTMIRRVYGDEKTAALFAGARLDEQNINDVIRINLDELMGLSQMELEDSREKEVRDYFVMLCKTGLRFSDFELINEKNFVEENGRRFLVLFAHKTKTRAKIPIHDSTYDLARKYHFQFNDYTNAALNRAIKDFLENHHLFEDEVYYNSKIKDRIYQHAYLRRERITCHTGRRTFISIAVEQGVPISDIMSMTGHVLESTLKVYVDQFGKDRHEAINYMDF